MPDLYKVMAHVPSDVSWEDDSFASGWTASYVTLSQDGDIGWLTCEAIYMSGWIEKTGLNINAATYRYCIVCVKGSHQFAVEVYDGSWKQVTSGYENAPSDYDVKVYDLAGITTGTITGIRLCVGNVAELKNAKYDFIAFSKRFPQFLQDVMDIRVHQRESDIDEFEAIVDSKGPIEDDTVLLIHFDEGLGGKAFDDSKYENHGTISGAAWIDGKILKALSYTTDDYVSIATSAGGPLDPDVFSVEAWILTDTLASGTRRIFQRASSTYGLYLSGSFIVIYAYCGGVFKSVAYNIASLGTGVWIHTMGRYDGSYLRLYVNGVEVGTPVQATGAVTDGGATAYIGCASPGTQHWEGDIDELRIYNRALTVDEIKHTYRRGLPYRVFVQGRHIRIWINGFKVFAGVVEEVTPEEGGILRASGRCFGQKLLLRTKSKTFNVREVSLAVKDFIEDLTEVTTFQVGTPSPTVNITKDYKYEYIMDGLKDLAKQAGSDWEVKLGMGNDLRFRSRASAAVPTAPAVNESSGQILAGVRKESDSFRLFNKVTVVGGELSNFNNNPDDYTDTGDGASWVAAGGGTVTEDKGSIAYGECSLKFAWTSYLAELICRYDLGATGEDLTPFKYLKFHHRTDSSGIQKNPAEADFRFIARLKDTAGVTATKQYLPRGSVQPAQNFAEAILELSTFSTGGGFDWTHIRYIELECDSDRTAPGEGVKGNYWIDRLHFYASNVTKTASDSSGEFKHIREYLYRDDKLIDPDFVSEVANALLNILKNTEKRFRIPVVGNPSIQVGHKVTVNSPTHGLNGTYYVVEAGHRVSSKDGYVTEMTLEKPRLYLETLLAEAIERRIKIIERGRIA